MRSALLSDFNHIMILQWPAISNTNGLCEYEMVNWLLMGCKHHEVNRPLNRYAKLRAGHAPGMPGTFSPPTRFSDPDIHHGTCVTHVSWCLLGSLTGGFLWSRYRGKRSLKALSSFSLLVMRPGYSRRTRSITWLPMPQILTSPGHQ